MTYSKKYDDITFLQAAVDDKLSGNLSSVNVLRNFRMGGEKVCCCSCRSYILLGGPMLTNDLWYKIFKWPVVADSSK